MNRTRTIARAGMIAAVYAALTVLTIQFLGAFAWGPIQFRVSEAVTVVALYTRAAVPGLFVGSLVANLYTFVTSGSPFALLDVAFGSLGSLAGAYWTWKFRRNRLVALLGPVIANALIVPAYLPFLLKGFGVPLDAYYRFDLFGAGVELGASAPFIAMYLFGVVAVGLGQAIVVYGLGLPLSTALSKLRIGEMLAEDEPLDGARGGSGREETGSKPD